MRLRYLHPEEGDAGQEINGRLQVLEALGVSCWEIILRRERRKRTEGEEENMRRDDILLRALP